MSLKNLLGLLEKIVEPAINYKTLNFTKEFISNLEVGDEFPDPLEPSVIMRVMKPPMEGTVEVKVIEAPPGDVQIYKTFILKAK